MGCGPRGRRARDRKAVLAGSQRGAERAATHAGDRRSARHSWRVAPSLGDRILTGLELSVTGANCGHEPRFVEVGGTRTRYYDVGSGEVVVLCHGAGWSGA